MRRANLVRHFKGLPIKELKREVKAEVLKPFEEKLERAITLLKLWSKVNSYVSCSFGKDSMIVLHLALQIKPDIPVVFVNTGVDFHETIRFKDEIVSSWKLNYFEVKANTTFWRIMDREKKKGRKIDDGSKRSNVCCYHLKEKPLKLFVRKQGFTHTFTGLTAMESRRRMLTACEYGMEYYAKKDEVWKVHPILFWKPSEVSAFIKEHNIPMNPIYQKYDMDRTGCMCCICFRGWREQLGRINPKLYRFIMERYFAQKVLV